MGSTTGGSNTVSPVDVRFLESTTGSFILDMMRKADESVGGLCYVQERQTIWVIVQCTPVN
jgi:hypothetical protein